MVKSLYLWRKSFAKSQDWKRVQKVMSMAVVFGVFLFGVQSVVVEAKFECETAAGVCFDVGATYTAEDGVSIAGGSQSDYKATSTHTVTSATKLAELFCGLDCIVPIEGIAEIVMIDDPVSEISRKGIYGLSTEAMHIAMLGSPTINVYQHIAQDWIPGNQASTSVYAADSGYDVLMNSGISSIWEKTRNVAYLLFVLVLIVAGFMIMFRQKIGGQTAVTVMNTIPNVLISLILVTFSFAIVGILMNFGGILINVMIGILDLNSNEIIYMDGVLSIMEHFFKGGVVGGDGWSALGAGTGGAALGVGANMGAAYLAGLPALAGSSAALATGTVAALPIIGGAFLALGLLAFFIAIAVIGIIAWASIKVFFTLLKAYLGLLLDTVMAPIYLAISAIPGQEKARGDWFRRVMKNIMIFPTVFFIVNVGTFIFNNGIEIAFPGMLTGGTDYSGVGTGTFATFVITRSVIIYLYFLAAQAPKLLEDFFPQSGGKGVGDALKGAAAGVPLIGGMFG